MEAILQLLTKAFGKRRYAKVIICLTLMAYGISNSEINKRIGITFPTLRKYKNVLESGEIEELVVFKGERTKSALDDYEEVILKEFDSNPPKTLRDAKERILRLTGLNRSLHRIRVWLEKRGSKAAR